MTYENVKSLVLTLLVFLSLFLTWRLWAFQPEYDLLDHNEVDYIENEPLSEVKVLSEVIYPEKFIFHYENMQTIAEPNEVTTKELYLELLNSKIDQFRFHDQLKSLDFQNSVEMILPAPLSYEVITNLFQLEDAPSYPLKDIERMVLYANDETENTHLRFISTNENNEVEVVTTLSYNNFVNHYLQKGREFPQATYIAFNQKGSGTEEKLYVPRDTVMREQLTYTIYPLTVNTFINILFSDPSSVKFFRQYDGEETYTDGNRMISLINNRNIMDYINPIYTDSGERSSRHIVISGYDYINGHGGWTDNYQLSDWTSNSLKEEVNFLMVVEGMPVFLLDGEDVLTLSVSRTGSQISRYTRPLFELDNEPINANQQVVLQSGSEVIQEIQNRKSLLLPLLENITVGYEMKKQNAFVTLTPHWFMKYGGKWEKVFVEE